MIELLPRSDGQHKRGEIPWALNESNPLFAALTPEKRALFLRYEQERSVLEEAISQIARDGDLVPVAHGTSSNYLESILAMGLGGLKPKGALSGTRSVTAATSPDGFLGAYLFAKGLMEDKLAIRREEVDPNGDILARFTVLSPFISEDHLRLLIKRYFEMRALILGEEYKTAYPVLLIAAAKADQLSVNNPNVPSERVFEGTLSKDTFSLVLVPEQMMPDAREKIDKAEVSIDVRAIEAAELF